MEVRKHSLNLIYYYLFVNKLSSRDIYLASKVQNAETSLGQSPSSIHLYDVIYCTSKLEYLRYEQHATQDFDIANNENMINFRFKDV